MASNFGLTLLLATACFATTTTERAIRDPDFERTSKIILYLVFCIDNTFLFLWHHIFTVIAIVLTAGYILWWRRRFVLGPLLLPNEPPVYPYWIPVIGHTFSMFWDPQRLVDNARFYFRDDRRPFTITTLGSRFHFITSSKDVPEVYRKTSTLTHDIFLDDLMIQFGISSDTRKLIFFIPDQRDTGQQLLSPNPDFKSLARLTVDMFRQQMAPGAKLHRLGEITMASIEPLTRCMSMDRPYYTIRELDGYRDISLLHWCEDLMLKTANRTFFGEALDQVAPDIIKHFLKFDELSYCAIFQYPYLLSKLKGMIKTRNVLIADLERYFRLPISERSDRNWFIEQQENEFINLGLGVKDIAKLVTMTFWVINTNVYKLLFWMLCYLLRDPVLTRHVTNELKACFDKDGKLDVDALTERGRLGMPFTNAHWHEVLRITGSASSARSVETEEEYVGGLKIWQHDRVIVPYRQMHYDPNVFGGHPSDFNFMQWLERDNLERHLAYRPFGGGVWYCPGRHLAKQEIFMAIAFLLYRYDVELAPRNPHWMFTGARSPQPQKMPRMDEKKPGIGVVSPVSGDDFILRLRKRDWNRFEAQKGTVGEYELPVPIP